MKSIEFVFIFSIATRLPDYFIFKIINAKDYEFKIGKDDKESMLIKGVIFATDKTGNKYVFNFNNS